MNVRTGRRRWCAGVKRDETELVEVQVQEIAALRGSSGSGLARLHVVSKLEVAVREEGRGGLARWRKSSSSQCTYQEGP